MQDILTFLLTFFILDPVQAEIMGRIGDAETSMAMAGQVRECLAAAAQELPTQAMADLWWAIRTIITMAVGLGDPVEFLSQSVPACGPLADPLAAKL